MSAEEGKGDVKSLQVWPTQVEGQVSDLEARGRELGSYMPRLQQFASVLSHPEFAKFFETNFQTVEDARASVMLLHTGKCLQEMYRAQHGTRMNGHELTAAMFDALHNPRTRQMMAQALACAEKRSLE